MQKGLSGNFAMSAFTKDLFRSVKASWGRFLAILVIVALGAGFYAGLRMSAPDMRLSADSYYDGTSLYDIQIMSTLGLSNKQIDELRNIEDVAQVMPAYQTDVTTLIKGEQCVVRMHSLDIEAALESDTSDGINAYSNKENYLNRPILIEGEWPTEKGQCALSAHTITSQEIEIGDIVSVVEGVQPVEDTLTTTEFTVVGFVQSSYYASSESLGVTSLGSGAIQQYAFIPESNFGDDMPFTQVFFRVAGTQEELSGSEAYKTKVDEVVQQVEQRVPGLEAQRLDEIKADAQSELDEKRSEYNQEKTDAQHNLDKAEGELRSALSTLNQTSATLAQANTTLQRSESALLEGEQALQSAQKELDGRVQAGKAKLDEMQAKLTAWETQLDEIRAQITSFMSDLARVQEELKKTDPNDPAFARLKKQEATLIATIDATQATLSQQETELAAAKQQLKTEAARAEEQRAQGQAQIDEKTAQLNQARVELAAGKSDYQEGHSQYSQGLSEYEQGRDEYESEKTKAENQLADAEAELDDAQAEIDSLEAPQFYVLDRTKNIGAESYDSDAGRIDQIAQVFPLLFFLVAALVALTTMTRMVEEERILIGTYKALGYGRSRIASKYISYAFMASIIGCVIGIATLTQILPLVIMDAYQVMYDVPIGPCVIDPAIGLLSVSLGAGITCLAAWGACFATLREKPASLMLPRAPKPGKRILLERIGFIWRRLSFTWKVTCRNIFRYKKRLAMTLIGIAGCTALMLTGFGLNNAIDDIIPKQFGQIYEHNATIQTEDEVSSKDQAIIDDLLSDGTKFSQSTRAFTRGVTGLSSDGNEITLHMTVPQSPDDMAGLLVMRERVSQKPLTLEEGSIILSEKLAASLGAQVGNQVTLAEQDEAGYTTETHYQFLVGGIMENYVDHYAVVHPSDYKAQAGEEPLFKTIYAMATTDESARAQISAKLQELESVRTVSFNDEVIESYEKGLEGVDTVVYVLIIAAAALAFVVLYNLTNINITERQREIATLKVLGFTQREVGNYIFRETILLTFLGAAIGLVLGVFMETFVVTTAEVDAVMFGREIHILSFVLAFVLTIVFSAIVAFAMRGKLNRINMVESLKSNE